MALDKTLKDRVLAWCRQRDIPLAGVAPAERWAEPGSSFGILQEFGPRSIFPGTQSVISIGLPVLLPVLETAPSIWYREHYITRSIPCSTITPTTSLFF